MLDAQEWDEQGTVEGFDVVLTQGVTAGRAARQTVLARNATLPTRVRDDVLLLVSELVTNAVRHAGAGPDSPLRVRLRHGAERVLVAVTDKGPGFSPPATPAGLDASGGWGLYLMDRIADRWGVEPTPSGSRVWFEIAYEE
jgi:anti-sigma regulatory factor (Ser/Thr protein kinase)